MLFCANCGQENPDVARFCLACGASLVDSGVAREERKVVTVLFADLVGFTSRAEQLDPEDVRAMLSPYYARLRSELERRGGTVEKFIGDAVMALFGAPVAHEDDPERAVRAALAIRDGIAELNEADPKLELQVRIAVNTGEALIALGARLSEGEGMASGDVVNTTARLQASAPVNGILVGETTYRATERTIEYREAPPITAKGKAAPVIVWEALEPRARFGVDIGPRGRATLVGRERELDILLDALARARNERASQLVTLVGVPGIGKSRLVVELSAAIEDQPELIFWRQGRSLPYGEGVTFWALAEIVKAQAGILETDSAEQAREKLRRTVEDGTADSGEAAWIEGHLRPLVGLEDESQIREDRQAEAFGAWRRFFEHLAERSPLVLVFEDLHWADDGLLDFIDYLAEWASDVRLLVVCVARPELLTRRPGWGGGKPNATTLSLSPLSRAETARLVALPPDEKALVQDAAVLGKVFWIGAVAAVGKKERSEIEQLLHALGRKEFVRRERRSSVAGEEQYTFLHVLVRDVAYGQIPRGGRSARHRAAAEWIASLGVDRSEERAEMLAHHYLSAIELARAAGQEARELANPARLALCDAGDRAQSLNAFAAAARFYAAALELSPTGNSQRPHLLLRLGRARHDAEGEGMEVLIEARDALLAAGEREAAAEAEVLLGDLMGNRGQRDLEDEHLERAAALVADVPPSRSKAYTLNYLAMSLMLRGHHREAIRVGREALGMAQRLGLEDLRAHALNSIGTSRTLLGDTGGIDDIERSLAIALENNLPGDTRRGFGNLAEVVGNQLGDLGRAFELRAEALRVAERFGLAQEIHFFRAELAIECYWTGRWDEGLELADGLLSRARAGSPHYMDSVCWLVRGRIGLARGNAEAFHDAANALEVARVVKDSQVLYPAVAFRADAELAAGRTDEAGALADELLSSWSARPETMLDSHLQSFVDLAVVLSALGRGHELIAIAKNARLQTRWIDAAKAFVSGEFVRAAEIYHDAGSLPDEAFARLRAAEAMIGEGRRTEGDQQLQRALAFYRSVGATAYLREGETLLARTA